MKYKFIEITKYLHDCFKINFADKVVYFDPFKLPADAPKASIIFITHEHFDHCDLDSLKQITISDTFVVGNAFVFDAINGKLNFSHFIRVEPCTSGKIEDIEFTTINAYNINKFREPGKVFHPKENNGVGYIVEFKEETRQGEPIRIYHAGDTDFIDEIKEIPHVNIAIFPVSGTYVMTPEEAAEAANFLKADISIPMHYDAGVVGSSDDAEKFKELVTESKVEVLNSNS